MRGRNAAICILRDHARHTHQEEWRNLTGCFLYILAGNLVARTSSSALP